MSPEQGDGAGREVRDSGLFVPLKKPPQAQTLTVRKLLGRVAAGEIRLPAFQRPLRWTASHVVTLFDSILRGYPVGSLLFWKKTAPAESLLIGSARIEAPGIADAWFVVDGQQRTTALAAALLDLDQGADTRWAIRFDPAEEAFFHGPERPFDLRRHVPASILGDIRRLGRWLRDCALDESEQKRVEDVQQRLLDYELPVYVVETDDGDALRGVFARLNSTGVRMRADEVFQALLGSEHEERRGAQRTDLAALQEACDVDGFGEPPRPEVLKALLAMSGLDPSRRLEQLGEDAATRLVGASDAIEALGRAVAFLQAPSDAAAPGAGIPHYGFIPYPVVFVLLARWFHLFPEPDASMRRELSRWVWRGVATGVHQRAAVSAMRLQVREIHESEGMVVSMRRLLAAVGEPTSLTWNLDPFHAKHAASRVEVLALLARGPRDDYGPVKWQALAASGERVAREIFRPGEIGGSDEATHKLARTVANRVLLDLRHTGLRGELLRWTWEAESALLESHLVDEEGLAALKRKDIGHFLRHRASRIRGHVAGFLSTRAGLGEPRIFPAASYYEPAAEGE